MGARPVAGAARARGLALIVVLWSVALVTVLATGFSFSLRTEARLAAGVVDRARAGAAAEAGVRRLMATLAAAGRRGVGALQAQMSFEGIEVALAVKPENALVDLNAAPEPLIESLVTSLGARVELRASPAAIAAAILDWRDGDDTARPSGAEAGDYEAAGLAARPRNGAFLSVSELSGVMGVDAPLFAALAPLVTVYAWSPQVDPMNAPREVLLGLPGLSPGQVDTFIQSRELAPDDRKSVALLSGAQRYLARSSGSVFSLVARARTPSGVVVARRAVVKISGSVERPVSVLAWFEDVPPDDEPADPAASDAAPGSGG